MADDESIRDTLKRIDEKLDKKSKDFKIPFFQQVKRGKRKKGWVTAVILRNNSDVQMKRIRIEDNVVKVPSVDKDYPTYHEATADEVFLYKNNPIVFIPEWDEKPLGKKELVKEAKDQSRLTFAQKFIYAKMRRDLIKTTTMNIGKILLIVVVIGGILLAGNYFGLFG